MEECEPVSIRSKLRSVHLLFLLVDAGKKKVPLRPTVRLRVFRETLDAESFSF